MPLHYYKITDGEHISYDIFDYVLNAELYPNYLEITAEEFEIATTPPILTASELKESKKNLIYKFLADTDKTAYPDRVNDLNNQNEFVEYRLTLRKILYNWQDLTLEQINSLIPVKPTEQRKALPNII